MAGSIPKAMPEDVYAQIIEALHSVGSAAVLDASGKAFAAGLEAMPDVIKPNRQECAEYLGKSINSEHDVFAALEALGKKAKLVILSDGANGSWFFDAEGSGEIKFMAAPEVDVADTTGAGDALFSSFIHFYAKGLKPLDCLKRAEVFAAYKIGFDGASVGFTDEVTVEKLVSQF